MWLLLTHIGYPESWQKDTNEDIEEDEMINSSVIEEKALKFWKPISKCKMS